MGSTRLRLPLVSMMAVFAISAVASASASAAGTCYHMTAAEKEKGRFTTKATCEAGTPIVATGEWIKIKTLFTELAPGEWCGEVQEPGTGRYSDTKCTVPDSTNEYTKVIAFSKNWQVCQKGGTEKWSEHKCNAGKGTGEWSWLPIEAGKSFEVTSSGGEFVLTAGGKTVSCKKVTDSGTIEAAGADKAKTITFEECTTGAKECEVTNKGGKFGTVVVSEIPTKLETVVIGEEEVLVDTFFQKTVGTAKEFVTLEFKGAGCSAGGYVETKVKGDVAAEVKDETNGEVKLTFPKTPITVATKLEAFGDSATLVGSDNEALVNGWAFRGV